MSTVRMTFQDIDDPNWSDEEEARFWAHVAATNANDLFRPRDASDADVPSDTMRGRALALLDELAGIEAEIATALGMDEWRLVALLAGRMAVRSEPPSAPEPENQA